jgi:SAM-dependent methyltransferase/uncharacterized protein YbaR (Trm112 family)
MPVDPKLLELLECPRHALPLREAGAGLRCEEGHDYPVINDVPVLLDHRPQTLWVADSSLEKAQHGGENSADPYYIETLGVSDEERNLLRHQLGKANGRIDPVVSFLVGATNGIAYQHLIGKLDDYPIPELRLPPAKGELFLDVGCNWGRWCVAAARAGYSAIGIDPNLGAVLAAKRITAQMGLEARFVVGDARFLPFRPAALDVVFSYSVIQHFSFENAATAIGEVGRVLKANGKCLIQMPTVLGSRCLYHQLRRGFRPARDFEVRYWSIPALRRLFTEAVGRSSFSVDCFFGIGLQAADLRLMPFSHRVVIHASELLRKMSRLCPWLYFLADSVYIEGRKSESTVPVPARL